MVDQETLEALPKRPREEMIDGIGRSIAVHVTDNDDNVYGVRVLTTANNRSKLWIECAPTALLLLTKKPKAPLEPTFEPVMVAPGVG
eukprot:4737056-Pyramimonas_sp.AAC.1